MALEFSVLIGPLNLAEFTKRILQKYSDAITTELKVRTPGPDKKIWRTVDVTDGVLISNKSSYLPYILKGTGLHGPRHDWIRPKKAMVLSWDDGGKRVFVAKSAGMPANPFVTKSIEAGGGGSVATSDDINGIIDTVISRLTTNVTSLGGSASSPIVEGDELPAQIREFPAFYVIPLISGGDHISQKMSGSPRFHEFHLTVVGVYKSNSISSLLRSVRNYGYAAVDLFSLENQKITNAEGLSAYCLNPVLEVNYHYANGSFIHTWAVDLSLKTVTE